MFELVIWKLKETNEDLTRVVNKVFFIVFFVLNIFGEASFI